MPTPQQAMQSDVGIIQENFKAALWEAFDRNAIHSNRIDNTVNLTRAILERTRDHTRQQGDNGVRFIRYWLMPNTGEWSMIDLEPNRGLPPLPKRSSRAARKRRQR